MQGPDAGAANNLQIFSHVAPRMSWWNRLEFDVRHLIYCVCALCTQYMVAAGRTFASSVEHTSNAEVVGAWEETVQQQQQPELQRTAFQNHTCNFDPVLKNTTNSLALLRPTRLSTSSYGCAKVPSKVLFTCMQTGSGLRHLVLA